MSGLLIDDQIPEGWEFGRDHYNGCAETLFDENAGRAPAEMYEDLPFGPPPNLPSDGDALGWAMIVGSLVAGTAILWMPRP